MSIRTVRICVFTIMFGGFTVTHTAVANVVFTVNTTDDGVDATPGNGTCSTSSTTPAPPNTCTLRAALMEANRTTGAGATIMLPAGLYKLAIGAHDADGEDNGDLNLSVPSGYTPGPTTITGAGAASTIIDAQQIDRVLTVDSNRTASISGVTFRNGFTGGNGGGINNAGILALTGSTLSTNAAGGGGGGVFVNSGATLAVNYSTLSGNNSTHTGGGILNEGTLAVSYSTLSDNIAASYGGGIYSSNGVSSTVSQSTISANTAAHNSGGGIFVSNTVLTVTDSTIALNNADVEGGGIYNTTGTNTNVNIYSSTIAYNLAPQDPQHFFGSGGGVFLNGSDGNGFNVYNTILAENGDDCTIGNNGTSTGVLKTHARNLFGTGFTFCTIAPVSGSYTTLNPLASLGGLQNNGGPTETIALLAGSNAIDGTSVTGSICYDASVQIVADQRGYPRTGACDVGAFEYDDIFIDGFE